MGNVVISALQLLAGQLDVVAQVIGGLLVLLFCLAIWWHRRQQAAKKPGMASWYFIAPCLFIAVLTIAAASYGIGIRSASGLNAKATETTVAATGASVRLQMRPNQDPVELSKDNVWRWFVFKNLAKDAKGKTILIGTYIFLVFDKPVPTSYRRVISQSHPNVRFQIIEFTERSMVIFAPDVDLEAANVEVEVSGKPI
jgi:hypothetical protein